MFFYPTYVKKFLLVLKYRLQIFEGGGCFKYSVCFLSGGDGNNAYDLESLSAIQKCLHIWRLSVDLCNATLSEKSIRNLTQSKDLNFDFIIMEAFFSDCFPPFGHKFKAHIIKFCTFGGIHWMGDCVGNPSPLFYVPYGFSDFNDRLGFWERLLNIFYGIFFHLGRQFYFLPRMDKAVRPFFMDYILITNLMH